MQPDELASTVVVTMKAAIAPLQARQAALEAALEAWMTQLEALVAVTKEIGPLRERLAALEARPLLPGPPGPPGEPGAPGAPGPPGTAGLVSKGDFVAGTPYAPGDLVRYRRAIWICETATTDRLPGDGSPAWKLWLKANDGRDGRDGKDAR